MVNFIHHTRRGTKQQKSQNNEVTTNLTKCHILVQNSPSDSLHTVKETHPVLKHTRQINIKLPLAVLSVFPVLNNFTQKRSNVKYKECRSVLPKRKHIKPIVKQSDI